MYHYFYAIYSFVNRKKLISIGLFIGMLLVFIFFASKIKFSEDITKLIPTTDKSNVTAKVLNQLNFADKITVTIHLEKSGTPEDLAEYAQIFIDSVSKECKPYINSIQGKIDEENIQETLDFVQNNLPLFLDEKDYKTIEDKLQKDSVSNAVAGNYKSLISPAGFVTKDFVLKDPLGISFIGLKKLQQLNIGDDFQLVNGFVMTKDKKKLLLFITPTLPSSETEKNTFFVAKLNTIKDQLNKQFKTKAEANYFGSTLIAVANANQIKSDIVMTTSVAMITLMLILILFYRNIYIPLIVFLPTVFGGLFAIALLYFIKGTISAISLGIGSILLGITIDYSLHILTHYKHNNDIKNLYKDITMPLIMSSTTTAVAFLCLLFVKSEALQDLGIFAAIIVIASAVFSLLLVPHLYKIKEKTGEHKKNIIDNLSHFSFHKNKWLIGSCIIIIGICFFTSNNVVFNNDLSQLNYIPKEIKAAEKELEQSSNLTSKTIYLASYGNSLNEVLHNNSKLFTNLSLQKENQKILNYSSIGGIVISEKEQQQKIDRWNSFWDNNKKTVLAAGLVSEGSKFGFKPTTYHLFLDQLNRDFKPLTFKEYESLNALQLKEFVTEKNGFFTISTLVKVASEQRDSFVKSMSSEAQLKVIDRQQMNETFLGQLKGEFNTLVNYSFIAVVLILFFFFRRIELVIISCIPIVITGVVTAGIMGIFNIQLNIFSVIVCTLVFGHGVDFSIFMTSALQKEYTNGKNEIAIYRTSIILAAITTILGIGALIFAKHPALISISSVSLIGVFAALIITFIFYPILFKFFFSNRPKNGKAPFEFKRLIHSTLSFTYYGLGGFLISITSVICMKIIPISRKRKELAFHIILSKFMKSVLMSYPSVKRKIINTQKEDFDKPGIIIANHTSFLDILAVGLLSPKIIFLVSDWVYNSPIFGRGVRLAGFYPVSNGIDNGVEHLREKVAQGYSLMVFPEGSRSESNSIQRFHKGAFYLAEELQLDIIPVFIHGYSEILPKGDFIINGGNTTVEILDRILVNDTKFGNDYSERTKKVSTFFKDHFKKMRQNLEEPNYFKKTINNSFAYKESDVVQTVNNDLNKHLELYHKLNPLISAKARILHLGNDYGQLDVLLSLQEPHRKIDSFLFDEEKRLVAKTNYIVKKRNINYLEAVPDNPETYNVVLISNENIDANLEQIATLAITIILVNANNIKETMTTYGFRVETEIENLIILKKEI